MKKVTNFKLPNFSKAEKKVVSDVKGVGRRIKNVAKGVSNAVAPVPNTYYGKRNKLNKATVKQGIRDLKTAYASRKSYKKK